MEDASPVGCDRASGILVRWESQDHIAHLRFQHDEHLTEEAARDVIAHLATLLDVHGAPINVLIDGRRTEGLTLLARLAYTEFLRRRRDEVHVAIFGLPTSMRIVADAIATVTRARLHVVHDEAAGRRWLQTAARKRAQTLAAK